MDPKRIAIRPDSIGGKTLYVNVRSTRDGHTLLHEAIERFVATIGLVVAESHAGTDTDGVPFVNFTIGTGKVFVAFEAYTNMND